jgi:hypothetical protein
MPTDHESFEDQQRRVVRATLNAAHSLAHRFLSGEVPDVGVSSVDVAARFDGVFTPEACIYLSGAGSVAYVVSLGGTRTPTESVASHGTYRWHSANVTAMVDGVPVRLHAGTNVELAPPDPLDGI